MASAGGCPSSLPEINTSQCNCLRGRPQLHYGSPTQQFGVSGAWRSRRSKLKHKPSIPRALFGFGKEAPKAPKPAKEFSRQDVKRIKQEGPRIDDLVLSARQKFKFGEGKGPDQEVHESYLHVWVPEEVLGAGVYEVVPEWRRMPQMSYLEFYNGLQRRNWTNELYDPQAEPWRLAFYEANATTWGPSFNGYRVLITTPSGKQSWILLEKPGLETFTADHLAAGTKGGQWRAKRVPKVPETLADCGYNQVMEQLFQAYQQRLEPAAARQWQAERWVDQSKLQYDCPGEQLLNVSFHALPDADVNVPFWLLNTMPQFAVFGGALSFIFVCLYLAIFKPRKAMPSDAFMAIEFAQSKGQARQEGRTGVSFADVAGMDQTLQELQDIVEFLKNPRRYLALGTKPPKGVLLEGEPGTGKTLVAKAIAGEAGVPFYQMAGSEFVEAIVGVGAARVRDLFKRARAQQAPCIIFVDEIDAMGTVRADYGEKADEEREQTLNQLLTEMDGFTPDIGVVFIGATNRSDLLDPALMRAGRFDKKFYISRPNTQGRYDVLKVHTRKRPMAEDVDLMQIARDLPGLSGAELANVINEGALECARRGGSSITSLDIYNGIDRILQGIKRPGLPKRMQMRYRIAVHETGKALLATVLRRRYLEAGRKPHLEAVERVTILARGREFTRTIFLRGEDEDYTMATKARLLQRLRVILAGRAAEELVLPEGPTTYGRRAMVEAITLAQSIVANYGLTPLGITMYADPGGSTLQRHNNFEVSVQNIDEDLFGSGGSNEGAMYQPSDRSYTRIKKTAQDIVREAYAEDMEILRQHRGALEAATQALLDKETLFGADLEAFLDEHPAQPPTESEGQVLPLEQRAFQDTSGNNAYTRHVAAV